MAYLPDLICVPKDQQHVAVLSSNVWPVFLGLLSVSLQFHVLSTQDQFIHEFICPSRDMEALLNSQPN